MKLVIAEKAELGRNIAHAVAGAPAGCKLPYEGGGYAVCPLAGHVLQLVEPAKIDPERWGDRRDLSVLPILPKPWPKEPSKGKERMLADIRRYMVTCECVIHAGDPDDEGQMLVDEVIDHIGYTGPVYRVLINDNLDANIRRAFERMDRNEDHRGDGRAAEARSIADFCFGLNESRLIAAKAGAGANLTVGRVQTPTLGLVVRRDEEIMGHKAREYFIGTSTVAIDGAEMDFTLKPDKGHLDIDGRHCGDRRLVESALKGASGKTGEVATVVERKSYPAPLPYNLTDLTADMSKRFKMTAKAVLAATQRLRDDYRAITYNRSDCNYLPCEAHAEAPSVMGMAMGNIGAAWPLDFSIRGRCFDDGNVTAHTGIIPQAVRFDAEKLPKAERDVYTAIVERYAMQFMPAAEADLSRTEIPIDQGTLSHTAKREVEKGWKAIRDERDGDEKGMQDGWIDAGAHRYAVGAYEIEAKKTKPRPPYTEGTLMKDMASIAKYVRDPEIREILKRKDEGKKGEHGGIGTTATRAAIIEKLKERGYIETVKGRIVSTELGRQVHRACPPEIREPDLTAKWWLMCEEVREGASDIYSVAGSVCDEFIRHKETAYQGVTIDALAAPKALGACPICGSAVIDKGPRYKAVTCSSNTYKRDAEGKWVRVTGCGFQMWKTIAGKKLTTAQIAKLLDRGVTPIIKGFKSSKGTTFDAILRLDGPSGNIVFDFPDRRRQR